MRVGPFPGVVAPFEFGIRPSRPGGLLTGRDRALNGLLSLLTTAVRVGIALLAKRLEERSQNLTATNYVASGGMVLSASSVSSPSYVAWRSWCTPCLPSLGKLGRRPAIRQSVRFDINFEVQH